MVSKSMVAQFLKKVYQTEGRDAVAAILPFSPETSVGWPDVARTLHQNADVLDTVLLVLLAAFGVTVMLD